MILGDRKIKKAVRKGEIVIRPYSEDNVGQNSYDVTLGPRLLVHTDAVMDAKKPPSYKIIDIPEDGLVLEPGELYLGSINEYLESPKYVPNLDGRSSVGRLGIFIHVTAGRGDVGYCGNFTMEIVVVRPVRVYVGMPIGQLTFQKTTRVDVKYNKKKSAKYNSKNPDPMPSQMWRNFKSAANGRPMLAAVRFPQTKIISGSIGPMKMEDINTSGASDSLSCGHGFGSVRMCYCMPMCACKVSTCS